MNRAQRRAEARRVVKRGGISGHKVRVARSMFAAGLLSLQDFIPTQAAKDPGLTRRGRLFKQIKKLWTPKGV